jgi:multisubunit Na+/H+ antiporter MnhC subunit
MLVIVGLIVLLVAVIVALLGVLGNTGPTHPLTENFSVFGYHVTGSTGALFLFGIVIGAVAMLGLSVLLAGASRTAGRGRDARRDLARSQRETAFLNQERDERLEHSQQVGEAAGAPVNSEVATTRWNRVPLLGRWWRGRQPTGTTDVDRTRGHRSTVDTVSPQSRSVLTETEGHRNEHR